MTTPHLKTLEDIRAALLALVTEKTKNKPARFNSSYADGTWGVIVHPGGSVEFEGYAEEVRGPTGRLEQLQNWELLALAE